MPLTPKSFTPKSFIPKSFTCSLSFPVCQLFLSAILAVFFCFYCCFFHKAVFSLNWRSSSVLPLLIVFLLHRHRSSFIVKQPMSAPLIQTQPKVQGNPKPKPRFCSNRCHQVVFIVFSVDHRYRHCGPVASLSLLSSSPSSTPSFYSS